MSSGKSICDCPKPPGGKVICPSNHIAVCKAVNGVTESECIPVDDILEDTKMLPKSLAATVYSRISGRLGYSSNFPESENKLVKSLKKGKISVAFTSPALDGAEFKHELNQPLEVNEDHQIEISFSLPKELKEKLFDPDASDKFITTES